jgi:enamine deaminase RidA (YjgF/YER057c/UK114 family)
MERKFYPLYYAGKKQRFARSVVVGDIVFLSGSSGRTMETGDVSSMDVKEQMIVALDKIRAALEEVGSSMENIVKTTIYLKNVEDYKLMRRTEQEYYKKYAPQLLEEPPASTFVQPKSLAFPQMLVEIDAIAVIPDKKPGRSCKK